MNKLIMAGAGACALVAGVAAAGTAGAASRSSLNAVDKQFSLQASAGALFEVTSGAAANKAAYRADIKAYGAEMVTVHGREYREFTALGKATGAPIATAPLLPQQHIIGLFGQYNGRRLDCAYISGDWTAHVADINLYEKEVALGSDPQVKAIARKWLPVLYQHKHMAQTILLATTRCTA